MNVAASSWLLYSEGGAGKSHVAATARGPILVADTEGRAHLLPRPYTFWDPATGVFPSNLTEDSVTVVPIGSLPEFEGLINVLSMPEAPWATFLVDSWTVLVKIAEDLIVTPQARNQSQPAYKDLLKKLEPMVIQLKYLAGREDTQLETVIFTAWQDQNKIFPFMTGAIKVSLNHLFDVIAHIRIVFENGNIGQVAHIAPTQGISAKAPGSFYIKYGEEIINPNIKTLNEKESDAK